MVHVKNVPPKHPQKTPPLGKLILLHLDKKREEGETLNDDRRSAGLGRGLN